MLAHFGVFIYTDRRMNVNDTQLVKSQLKTKVPEFRVGDTIKVGYKVKEGDKERLTHFTGLVIARTHGQGVNATVTVRSQSGPYGLERIFPLHSPVITSIKPQKRLKVRRAKLYYLRREVDKKRRRFTTSEEFTATADEAPVAEPTEATPAEAVK